MSLDAGEVLRWAADWIWVPPDSPTVDTGEYLVVAHPPTWADPTGAFRIVSGRPAADLVDAVVATVGGLGRDAVTVWVHDGTRPAGLADELLARGARLVEDLAVLARPLDADLPDLDVPADVEVREAIDLDTQRDMDRVSVEVFGGARAADEDLASLLEHRDRRTDRAVVAYVDGRPVGAAGVALAGPVARLWGGSVVEAARGAGVYRALLARRLAEGRELGCTAALVKGRLATSAPTLRRAGFTAYGAERGYRLTWS